MADVTQALEALVLGGQEKTHPKIPNPHGLPLPRPGHLILRGIIHKEVRRHSAFRAQFCQVFLTFVTGSSKQIRQRTGHSTGSVVRQQRRTALCGDSRR
jgi:hypothetical protein